MIRLLLLFIQENCFIKLEILNSLNQGFSLILIQLSQKSNPAPFITYQNDPPIIKSSNKILKSLNQKLSHHFKISHQIACNKLKDTVQECPSQQFYERTQEFRVFLLTNKSQYFLFFQLRMLQMQMLTIYHSTKIHQLLKLNTFYLHFRYNKILIAGNISESSGQISSTAVNSYSQTQDQLINQLSLQSLNQSLLQLDIFKLTSSSHTKQSAITKFKFKMAQLITKIVQESFDVISKDSSVMNNFKKDHIATKVYTHNKKVTNFFENLILKNKTYEKYSKVQECHNNIYFSLKSLLEKNLKQKQIQKQVIFEKVTRILKDGTQCLFYTENIKALLEKEKPFSEEDRKSLLNTKDYILKLSGNLSIVKENLNTIMQKWDNLVGRYFNVQASLDKIIENAQDLSREIVDYAYKAKNANQNTLYSFSLDQNYCQIKKTNEDVIRTTNSIKTMKGSFQKDQIATYVDSTYLLVLFSYETIIRVKESFMNYMNKIYGSNLKATQQHINSLKKYITDIQTQLQSIKKYYLGRQLTLNQKLSQKPPQTKPPTSPIQTPTKNPTTQSITFPPMQKSQFQSYRPNLRPSPKRFLSGSQVSGDNQSRFQDIESEKSNKSGVKQSMQLLQMQLQKSLPTQTQPQAPFDQLKETEVISQDLTQETLQITQTKMVQLINSQQKASDKGSERFETQPKQRKYDLEFQKKKRKKILQISGKKSDNVQELHAVKAEELKTSNHKSKQEQATLKTIGQELQALQNQINEKLTQKNQLTTDIQNLTKAKQTVENIAHLIAEREKQLESLEQQLRCKKQQMQEAIKYVNLHNNDILEKQQKAQQLKRQLQKLQQTHKSTIQKQQQQKTTLNKQLSQLQSKLQTARNQLLSVQCQINVSKQLLGNINDQKQTQVIMRKQLETLTGQVNEKLQQLEGLSNETTQKQLALSELEKKLLQTKREEDKVNGEITVLNERVKAKKDQIDTWQKLSLQTNYHPLLNDSDTQNKRSKAYKQQISKLQQTKQQRIQQNNQLIKIKQQIQNYLTALKQQYQSYIISQFGSIKQTFDYESTIDNLQRNLQSQRQQNNKLSEENKHLSLKLQSMFKQLCELTASNQKLIQKLILQQEQHKQNAMTMDAKQLAQVKQLIKQLKEQVKNNGTRVQNQCSVINQNYQDIKTQWKSIVSNIKLQQTQKITQLQQTLTILQHTLQQQRHQNLKLQQRSRQKQDQVQNLNKQLKDYVERNADQLIKLRAQLQEKTQKLEDQKHELQSLSLELEEMQELRIQVGQLKEQLKVRGEGKMKDSGVRVSEKQLRVNEEKIEETMKENQMLRRQLEEAKEMLKMNDEQFNKALNKSRICESEQLNVKQMTEQQVRGLQNQLEYKNDRIQQLQAQVLKQQTQIVDLNNSMAENKKRLDQQRNSIETLEKVLTLKQGQLSSLFRQLENSKLQIQQDQQLLKLERDRITSLKKKIQSKDDQIEKSQRDLISFKFQLRKNQSNKFQGLSMIKDERQKVMLKKGDSNVTKEEMKL